MAVTHSAIADANKHQPKGVADAEDFTVYRADGAGSGSWSRPLSLLWNGQEASHSSTDYEITGLTGYQTLFLVLPIFYSNADVGVILQIDNSGTYRTSGYENAYVDNFGGTTDNYSSGFYLAEGRNNSRDYMMGVWRLDNCNGGIVTCTGIAGWLDFNYLTSSTLSSSEAMDSSFGRQTSASTVTKIKLIENGGSFSPGYRYVQVYGIR